MTEVGEDVIIIGAGLAGSEASWFATRAGVQVRLYEMRPEHSTPAHQTGLCAELVCSNSLKSNRITSASGLLKEEMRILGSVIVACADANRIPGGEALAVDRDRFAECVTARVMGLPNLTLVREEATHLPKDRVLVIASGPLTSDKLANEIAKITAHEHLYFHDAVAPTITAESINWNKVFRASRYAKGEAAYLNCPLTEKEFDEFWAALVTAERTPLAEFENLQLFEGCMPVEELASRGRLTLAFGPMKPVGLVDPRTGKRPFAVVQLRQENLDGTLWGMVGFQTRLRWREQERVFRMIPGLEQAEFVRYGVMHRNTYINSPQILLPTMQMRNQPRILFAGQITGVEGYVESAAMGIIAGVNAARLVLGKPAVVFPKETMMGALANYVAHGGSENFQPMNANFGLLPPVELVRGKTLIREHQTKRALSAIRKMASELGIEEALN